MVCFELGLLWRLMFAGLLRLDTDRCTGGMLCAGMWAHVHCSSNDDGDCPVDVAQRLSLETIFHQYGVDIVFEACIVVVSLALTVQAHEHSYERLYPVYNYSVLSFDYVDPPVCAFVAMLCMHDTVQTMVHLVTGAAGQGIALFCVFDEVQDATKTMGHA